MNSLFESSKNAIKDLPNTIKRFPEYVKEHATMDSVNKLGSEVSKPMVRDPAVAFLVATGLILYTVFFARKLNKRVVKMLQNPFVKMFFLFLILLLSRHSPSIALLLAIAVMSSYRMYDTELMTNVSNHHSPVKGNCSCVEWKCNEADGNTMSFDSDMSDAMLPGHDPSDALHHPSPEKLLHGHEQEMSHEDHAVQAVVEEKAKMEEQLQRPLSQEELQELCAKVGSTMPAQSAGVESFDDVVGFSGSAYASAN